MKRNEFAIAAVVFGVMSFIQLFGAEKAIPAIILGVVGYKASKKGTGKWLAVAGIALGVIYLIVLALALPAMMAYLAAIAG